jgi:hypothetical protein
MAIFHIREYPRFDAQKFAYNLGHCQEDSDVSEIDAHRRNILWIDVCRDPDERCFRENLCIRHHTCIIKIFVCCMDFESFEGNEHHTASKTGGGGRKEKKWN